MTRFLSEQGIDSKFLDGLRVSTPQVMDAVVKVLAGTVNAELVAALVAAGMRAVGLSGVDDHLAEAEQMAPHLGAVGRVVRGNPALLELLTANGFVPVVACIAGDRQGNIYNVNADSMAVACAAAFQADRLIFLTDVDGVRDSTGSVVPELTPADCRKLIETGVATGGMQAKLDAARAGVESGVGEVVIAPGLKTGALSAILAGELTGTMLRKG
jgi:acetylglutamate kinase